MLFVLILSDFGCALCDRRSFARVFVCLFRCCHNLTTKLIVMSTSEGFNLEYGELLVAAAEIQIWIEEYRRLLESEVDAFEFFDYSMIGLQ